MKPDTVRLPTPSATTPDSAPLWIRHILSSLAAYADFYTDLTRSIQRCESLISDHLSKGDLDTARILLGKREALLEQRFLVESYQREHQTQEKRNDTHAA